MELEFEKDGWWLLELQIHNHFVLDVIFFRSWFEKQKKNVVEQLNKIDLSLTKIFG